MISSYKTAKENLIYVNIKKIEKTIVEGYQKIEDGVVKGYKKILQSRRKKYAQEILKLTEELLK